MTRRADGLDLQIIDAARGDAGLEPAIGEIFDVNMS